MQIIQWHYWKYSLDIRSNQVMRNNETTLEAQGLINRNYMHTTTTPPTQKLQGRINRR